MNQNKIAPADYQEALKNSTPWDEMIFHDKETIQEIFGYTLEDIKTQRFLRDVTANVRLGSLVAILTVLTEPTEAARAASGIFVLWTDSASGVRLSSSYDIIKYINATMRDDAELLQFANRIRKMMEMA